MTSKTTELLVIDDDETEKRLFEIYCMDLKSMSVNCRFASELGAGLEMIRMRQPDLIFLDNRILPYENFTQTMPLLRQAGYEGPVVVMSASLFDPVFDEARAWGVATTLDKLDLSSSTIEELAGRLLS